MKKPSLNSLDMDSIFKAARNGDREAFGEVIVRWEKFIKASLVKTLSCPEDREDAFQYIALALMTEIKNVKHNNFQGWMKKIIKCRRYDFLRTVIYKTRILRAEQEVTGYDYGMNDGDNRMNEPEGGEGDPALICERLEIQDDVREAIGLLPAKQKRAVQDVYLDEKSKPKAAKKEEIGVGGIKYRLDKARELLQNSLPQYQHPLL